MVAFQKVMDFMQIKTKGLYIEYNQGHLALSMTEDAVKEFCDYYKIPYTEEEIHTNGVVTTKILYIHSHMFGKYAEILLNNNWRKRHGVPMIRKCSKRS